MASGFQTTTILDLIETVIRSWWRIVAGVCVGLSASLVAIHFTTPIYEARATVFAGAEQLPEGLVRETVTDDLEVRLQMLRQEVLSREHLLELIANTIGMPEFQDDQEALIRRIRWGVSVSVSRRARFLDIRFQDRDPIWAAEVANGLAELYKEEHSEFRVGRAGHTTDTLEKLAAGVLNELHPKDEAIAELLSRNPAFAELIASDRAAMIAPLPALHALLERRRTDLEDNLSAQSNVRSRIRAYEAQQAQEELFDSFSSLTSTKEGSSDSTYAPSGKLEKLESELESLLARYSENHPDVRELKRRIADLKTAEPRTNSSRDTRAATEPSYKPNKASWLPQIRAAQRELDNLDNEAQMLRSDMSMYERLKVEAPAIADEYRRLQRESEALQTQFGDYQAMIQSAKAAQTVEESRSGKELEVVGLAAPPRSPVWPSRFKFLGVGIVAGLLVFVGPGLARHWLNPVILSEAGLKELSDIPLLVSVPTIPSVETRRRTRRRWQMNIGLSLVSVVVLVSTFVTVS